MGRVAGKGYLDIWIDGDRLRKFTSVTSLSDASAIPLRIEQEYWSYNAVPALKLPDGLPTNRPR